MGTTRRETHDHATAHDRRGTDGKRARISEPKPARAAHPLSIRCPVSGIIWGNAPKNYGENTVRMTLYAKPPPPPEIITKKERAYSREKGHVRTCAGNRQDRWNWERHAIGQRRSARGACCPSVRTETPRTERGSERSPRMLPPAHTLAQLRPGRTGRSTTETSRLTESPRTRQEGREPLTQANSGPRPLASAHILLRLLSNGFSSRARTQKIRQSRAAPEALR